MTREAFLPKKFHATTFEVIERANEIISEYEAGGFSLTLRQLYYQFVSRRLIENIVSEYKRLGKIVNDGRLAGLIDWDGIEDRTRRLERYQSYVGPWDAIEQAARYYSEDPWQSQNYRPEVWIEKDALIGVIEGVCSDYHLPHFACRGNVSQSELYAAGKRFANYVADGLTPIVLHLGDHDPNGLDMTRDNRERLRLFAGADVEVRRLALNLDQVERYALPPNPAKETDSRFSTYVKNFDTRQCWELDALAPNMIANLIRAEIDALINKREWRKAGAKSRTNRATLALASENWSEVENLLRGHGGTS
jgi:hypothetical protein